MGKTFFLFLFSLVVILSSTKFALSVNAQQEGSCSFNNGSYTDTCSAGFTPGADPSKSSSGCVCFPDSKCNASITLDQIPRCSPESKIVSVSRSCGHNLSGYACDSKNSKLCMNGEPGPGNVVCISPNNTCYSDGNASLTEDNCAQGYKAQINTPQKCSCVKDGTSIPQTQPALPVAPPLVGNQPSPSPAPPGPCKKFVVVNPGGDRDGEDVTTEAKEGKLPDSLKFKYKCVLFDTAIGSIDTDPVKFATKIFAIVLSLAGGIALVLIMISGYQLMTSQGDPEKVKAAQEMLTSAIVGLLFIIFSLVILEIIGVDLLKIPGLGHSV